MRPLESSIHPKKQNSDSPALKSLITDVNITESVDLITMTSYRRQASIRFSGVCEPRAKLMSFEPKDTKHFDVSLLNGYIYVYNLTEIYDNRVKVLEMDTSKRCV